MINLNGEHILSFLITILTAIAFFYEGKEVKGNSIVKSCTETPLYTFLYSTAQEAKRMENKIKIE